jgi:hypothetical protein
MLVVAVVSAFFDVLFFLLMSNVHGFEHVTGAVSCPHDMTRYL